MSLDDHLQKATSLSPQLQSTITERLWGKPPKLLFNGEAARELNLGTYFIYYIDQCNQALHDGGRSTSVKYHREILEIAELLKTSTSYDVLKQTVPCADCNENTDKREGSINLAARLFLMMNFGKYRFAITYRKELKWEDGSMRQFLSEHFSADPALSSQRIRLEKAFHAQSLCRVAGIEIIPTNNLADHLRLSNDDRAVEIFHHVSFLEYQRDKSIFPEGLIDETLRTLALLFPQSEKPIQRWFEEFCSSQTTIVDPRLLKCGQLRTDDRQIETFSFWHDRLVMLKQVYDEARPGNISQWWYDRRNGVQWYTFWVAILVLLLTFFFGLVQSVEGAFQVYKAYYPTH